MMHLRDLAPTDKALVYQWRNLPEVARYMYTDRVISNEEHECWFNAVLDDPSRKYWIITYDGADVGLVNIVGLDCQNQRCSWAFYIADSGMRGKGLGGLVEYAVLSYVFDNLSLNKLCCEVLDFNQPVVDLHKGFGFVEEGRLRQHIRKGDSWYDVVVLGILREEWEIRRPEIEARLQRLAERQHRRKQG